MALLTLTDFKQTAVLFSALHRPVCGGWLLSPSAKIEGACVWGLMSCTPLVMPLETIYLLQEVKMLQNSVSFRGVLMHKIDQTIVDLKRFKRFIFEEKCVLNVFAPFCYIF